ncbi:Fimbrial subunit protein [Lactobacillus equicursoris 66c]|uniref:Fimbrial subunit protein n=1 Tax=Lactobacillus equicursoris 66c TaxID=872326 RepID=K0NRZ6_9LACO|nr:SpaH/EbpB family LPXTG-anchored major pilin [Lactobacillus equicursoris]CCK83661.1 Fimbrial subunit protein [Lactobacillus equicursoris 66c]CCK83873.1 Fimbrial subunit protein [Lactobacillus equicursoris 66c]
MKRGKIATLMAAFGLLMPVATSVVQADTTDSNYTSDKPSEVKVAIHKYRTTSDLSTKTKQNQDFAEKTTDDLKSLLNTQDLAPMSGVVFKWFKVEDDATAAELGKMNLEQLEAKYKTSGEVTTNENGEADQTVSSANYGKYYYVEVTKSENSFETAPFLLEVPSYVSKQGYAKTMNVYPKNKVTTPTPGKDVNELGNNNSGAKVGAQVKWYLKGTIPADIADYKTYEFQDTLDKALTYDDSFAPVVTVGTTKLTEGTDYTVTKPGADRMFKVTLTKEGQKKASAVLKAADGQTPSADEIGDIKENTNDNPFIEVEFATKINENAVSGKEIDNKVTLNYDNNGNVKGNPESDKTEVHTGGFRFVKKDAVSGKTLKGAEFALYEADGTTAVKWTKEMLALNKAAIDAGKFKDAAEGSAVVMVSGEDGSFEIQGLKYGENGTDNSKASTKYVAKETKAPNGYTLPDNADVKFTVTATSYYKDPTAVNLVAADPQEIDNNKTPNLPMTGGIGSAIFAILGLSLAGFGAFEIKKRRQA